MSVKIVFIHLWGDILYLFSVVGRILGIVIRACDKSHPFSL